MTTLRRTIVIFDGQHVTMGDKNNNNFMFQPPSSNHPSLHNTQQGARFVLLSRNSLAKPRGSLASGTTGLLGKDFTTQTSSFESQYGGLVRPVNNGSSLLQTYMWDGHKLKAHVERIISVKPRVDCTAPHVDSYKVFNMQKTRDMSRRKQKLDAENKSLVDRVTRIMTNGRSDLDCWNPDFYKPSAAYYKKQARKKRERDNSFLLERIMSVSVYHSLKLKIIKFAFIILKLRVFLRLVRKEGITAVKKCSV